MNFMENKPVHTLDFLPRHSLNKDIFGVYEIILDFNFQHNLFDNALRLHTFYEQQFTVTFWLVREERNPSQPCHPLRSCFYSKMASNRIQSDECYYQNEFISSHPLRT